MHVNWGIIIYDPQDDSRLPVMVYMHGGGFIAGSSNPDVHGPEYFMDTEEIILVTLNYRIGPLGFLSMQDDVIAGSFKSIAYLTTRQRQL